MTERTHGNSSEKPHTYIIANREKAAFGPNWVREDQNTAIARVERRKQRAHLSGLMQRCIEVCEEDDFIQTLCVSLAMWAERSRDGFAHHKAEQALAEARLIPDEMIN